MKRILYHGGFWVTNIGNAFIDRGSMYTIHKALPDATVHYASNIPGWFSLFNQKNLNKTIDLSELMDIDAIVVSGNLFQDNFILRRGLILRRLSDRGIKIVFNGCGCGSYQETEISNFKKFLKKIKAVGFISRDEVTYEHFKQCFSKSYNGMDCAFFIDNAFTQAPLTIKDYVVYNFDKMEEPKIENSKKIIRTYHESLPFFPPTSHGKELLSETQNNCVKIGDSADANWAKFKNKLVLISDLPDDYLNLYANAYAVFSDRVHACVATLSFGNFARLFSTTPRAALFKRVGAGEILNKMVRFDQDKIKQEKEKQVSFLREILKEV